MSVAIHLIRNYASFLGRLQVFTACISSHHVFLKHPLCWILSTPSPYNIWHNDLISMFYKPKPPLSFQHAGANHHCQTSPDWCQMLPKKLKNQPNSNTTPTMYPAGNTTDNEITCLGNSVEMISIFREPHHILNTSISQQHTLTYYTNIPQLPVLSWGRW